MLGRGLYIVDICFHNGDGYKGTNGKAKNVRLAAKGKFTRSVKTVNVLRYAERPIQEIQEALKETKDA